MAKNNAINTDLTRNADGFTMAGGTTERAFTLTGGDVTINGGGSATITYPTSTSTLATLALSETFTNKTFGNDIVFDESADHSSTPAAGKGYLWVKNTAPSTLVFTDDTGVDTTLGASGGGGLSGSTGGTDNVLLRADGTGGSTVQESGVILDDSDHLRFGGADGSAIIDIQDSTDSIQGLRVRGDATDGLSFTTYVSGDSFLRFSFLANGQMTWGDGTAGGDTNLYRDAANVLKTDDAFEAVSINGVVPTEASDGLTLEGGTSTSRTLTVTDTLSLDGGTSNMMEEKTTSIASSATPSPTGDARVNFLSVTALAAAAVIAAPSGTVSNGNRLIIRIKDNATARTIGYNSIFRAIGVTLPTTTTISKTIYLGCVYNSTDTKWDVIAVAEEA